LCCGVVEVGTDREREIESEGEEDKEFVLYRGG